MISSSQEYLTGKITKYLPEFVYGSIDGTVTTFAIIAGIAGANLETSIVAILGFSNILADGFSMASSNYLSEQSHQEQNPDQDHHSPIKTALATFLSFISIGSIPVIAYLIVDQINPVNAFLWTAIITGITFIGIGAVRGILSKKKLNTNFNRNINHWYDCRRSSVWCWCIFREYYVKNNCMRRFF